MAIAKSIVLFLAVTSAFAENWPQFRGPTGLGYAEEAGLPARWGGPTNANVFWKMPLRGQGHASPIVWGDSLFICTVDWPQKGASPEKIMPDHHVVSYAVSNGALLWDSVVPPGPWLRKDFRSGPGGGYAASTPATDGKLVYCVFGSSVMAALDFKGAIVWRKEIIPHTFDVTIGSSPILYKDTVILLCAMAKASDSRVIAYHKSSGEVKWQSKFPDMAYGHSTPVIIDVKGQPQMLVLASGTSVKNTALRSLDPDSGSVIWHCRAAGDAASPAYGGGIIYLDSGRGGQGFAIDPTGAGDVSETHIRWTVNQVPEGISSPIIVGKHVYRLHTPGILKCWELATGQLIYAERLEGLSSTWASPIADANGRIYFANAGKSYVIESGPEFRILAVNDLGEGSHPSPAVANGKIFLVGTKNVFSIGKR